MTNDFRASPRSLKPGTANPRSSRARQEALSGVARGGALNLIGATTAALAAMGVTVLVTRRFSPSIAGSFFSATSIFLIAQVLSGVGAKTGIVYFVARLRSLREYSKIPVILRSAVVPITIASILISALLFVFAGPVTHLAIGVRPGRLSTTLDTAPEALRALALALPFAVLLDTLLGATRGYQTMRCTVLVDNFGRSLSQFLGISVAAIYSSAALLAPLWALPYAPAALVAWLWFRRIQHAEPPKHKLISAVPPNLAALIELSKPVYDATRPHSPPSRGPATSRVMRRRLATANPRGFWLFTVPRGVAALTQILLQRLDIILVAVMRGPVDAAVYTAATRFLVVAQLAGTAINNASQPQFAKLFAVGDNRNARVVYRVTTSWLILVTWPLLLLAVIYAPSFLAVFGQFYSSGDPVVPILGITLLVANLCGQADTVLVTSGRSDWSVANGIAALAISLIFDFLLIPHYAIIGAAIGWAASIVMGRGLALLELVKLKRFNPFGREAFTAVLISCASFLAMPLVVRTELGPNSFTSAIGIALACFMMAAGLWYGRNILHLSHMPGASRILQRFSSR